MSTPLARASIVHMLPAYLAGAGECASGVFRAGGMEPVAAATGQIVHRAQLSAVLEGAARSLGQPGIGLALGSVAEPARLGRAGLALMSGRTIAECLRAHAGEMPAMQTHVYLGLRHEAGQTLWSHRLVGESDVPWILYEGAAAFHLRFLRSLLGSDWSPACVSFPHACRGLRRDYEDHFGAPVQFGRTPDTRFVLDPGLLRRRVELAAGAPDDGGPAELERELMSFRLRDDTLLEAVRAMVLARLAHQGVKLDSCARVLGMAPRTLQRRLDAAGLTFEGLVDDLRRDLAQSRLREGATITDTAMSLGYSDTAHFTRAFRRWTGMTPSAFRAGEG